MPLALATASLLGVPACAPLAAQLAAASWLSRRCGRPQLQAPSSPGVAADAPSSRNRRGVWEDERLEYNGLRADPRTLMPLQSYLGLHAAHRPQDARVRRRARALGCRGGGRPSAAARCPTACSRSSSTWSTGSTRTAAARPTCSRPTCSTSRTATPAASPPAARCAAAAAAVCRPRRRDPAAGAVGAQDVPDVGGGHAVLRARVPRRRPHRDQPARHPAHGRVGCRSDRESPARARARSRRRPTGASAFSTQAAVKAHQRAEASWPLPARVRC